MDPIKDMEAKTQEIIAYVREEFSKLHSNRPSTKLVEHIKVDYMGSEMQVSHIASLSINPPRDIVISPWDKGAIPVITKAIEASKLGLGIVADSAGIRLTLPDLSIERKKEMEKLIKSMAEENRIKMRNSRDKIMKDINILPEDEKFRSKDKVQKLVDKFNDEMDSLVKGKIAEFDL